MVLKDMDSEAGQHQGSMVVSSGPSRDAEHFSEVSKGVSSLEPVWHAYGQDSSKGHLICLS